MQRVKKKLGKYELGKTIGEGAFAKVKFAHNSETGEGVAIKVMAKSTILKHKIVEQKNPPWNLELMPMSTSDMEEDATASDGDWRQIVGGYHQRRMDIAKSWEDIAGVKSCAEERRRIGKDAIAKRKKTE
nr:CBL-interacting serine/threonine-protein kinase 24-like [Ipomoea batatas]